jgi:hypothetical protein
MQGAGEGRTPDTFAGILHREVGSILEGRPINDHEGDAMYFIGSEQNSH